MAFNPQLINPIDLNPNLAVGVNLPFSGPSVFTPNYLTSQAIKNNLINYFLTNPGEIPLDTHNQDKVVNIAYFMWVEFRAELDSGKYEDLKRALMPLWDYVELQVNNQNLVVL